MKIIPVDLIGDDDKDAVRLYDASDPSAAVSSEQQYIKLRQVPNSAGSSLGELGQDKEKLIYEYIDIRDGMGDSYVLDSYIGSVESTGDCIIIRQESHGRGYGGMTGSSGPVYNPCDTVLYNGKLTINVQTSTTVSNITCVYRPFF